MSDPVHLVAIGSFVLVGFTMGLLGGGGSVLSVPILVIGLGLDAHRSVSAALVVVALTSVVALVPHARAGRVHWRSGAVFGGAGMLGSFGAGFVARWIPGEALLVALCVMMVVVAVMMLRAPRAARAPSGETPTVTSPVKLAIRGLVVGAATGLVGAGGGFVVVPALVLLCRMPMDQAIGTSLFVIALQSVAGFVGHASHVDVPWDLVIPVSALAVAGSVGGAMAAGHVRPGSLRKAFGALVLAMAAVLLITRVARLRGADHAPATQRAAAATTTTAKASSAATHEGA